MDLNEELSIVIPCKNEKEIKKVKKEMNTMSNSLELLETCAERQKALFYENFLSRGRIGEILCVQNVQEDTVLFERWEIHGKGLVTATVLLCEDSLHIRGVNVMYRPIMEFVEDREAINKQRFKELEILLEKDGMTLEDAKQKAIEQGHSVTPFIYNEVTRSSIEDRLPPGKKTIQGDRRSEILVLERQSEIPSDLQQSRLNVYRVFIPEFMAEFISLKEDFEIADWLSKHTEKAPETLKIATTLPFVKQVHVVSPIIYEWPDKEVDVEKAVGYK